MCHIRCGHVTCRWGQGTGTRKHVVNRGQPDTVPPQRGCRGGGRKCQTWRAVTRIPAIGQGHGRPAEAQLGAGAPVSHCPAALRQVPECPAIIDRTVSPRPANVHSKRSLLGRRRLGRHLPAGLTSPSTTDMHSHQVSEGRAKLPPERVPQQFADISHKITSTSRQHQPRDGQTTRQRFPQSSQPATTTVRFSTVYSSTPPKQMHTHTLTGHHTPHGYSSRPQRGTPGGLLHCSPITGRRSDSTSDARVVGNTTPIVLCELPLPQLAPSRHCMRRAGPGRAGTGRGGTSRAETAAAVLRRHAAGLGWDERWE